SLDRQPPNRDQQLRANDAELALEPLTACVLLLTRRNPVAAPARTRTRKAARDRRDVDATPRGRLVDARAREPAEERLASASRKGATAGRFDLSRRLPDEHHVR